MKSYLDLIPISAKVHRKQTRMTRLCIVISVFLVTTIFGMADMFLQSQMEQVLQSDGAWHAAFKSLDEEQMAMIHARPEVKTGARYAATNYRLNMGYSINETQTVLCGFDETLLDIYPAVRILDGAFPQGDNESPCFR